MEYEEEYGIGKKLASQGQHAEALEHFFKILKEKYEDAWADDCAKSLAAVKPGTADEEELSLLGAKRSEYEYQSGRILLRQKRYKEALPFFRRAVMARPELKAWKTRYMECLLNNDYARITEEDLSLLGEQRQEYEYGIAGKKLASRGQHAEALEYFFKILKERYEDVWAYYCAQSLAAVKPGTADEEELSLLGAKRSEYEYQSGRVLLREERCEEALPFFRRAVMARPEQETWKTRYMECLVSMDFQSADDLALLGELEGEACYRLARKIQKSDTPYRALPMLERALELNPEKGWWWKEKGVILQSLGHMEEAESALGKAIEIGAKSEDLFYHCGMVKEALGKEEEARALYNTACQLGKKDSRYGAAKLHEASGKWPDAARAYEKYFAEAKSDSDVDATAHYSYGMALDLIYEWERAASEIEEAILLDCGRHRDWFARLGVLYERLGKGEAACTAFRHVLKFDSSPEITCRLANVMREMGKYEEACDIFMQLYEGIVVGDAGRSFPHYCWRQANESMAKGDYATACMYLKNIHGEYLSKPYKLSGVPYTNTAAYLDFIQDFPIDPQCILYESFLGNTMSCSPYAIFKYLHAQKDDAFLHVWVVNSMESVKEEYKGKKNILFVDRKCKLYAFFLATAKYLVNNVSFPSWFIRREGQVYCNTWHGTPLKCLGDVNAFVPYGYGNVSRNFLHATWLAQPNAFTNDLILDGYHVRNILPGQSIITGYPRQDLTLNMTEEEKSSLRETIAGDDRRPILLYAPTWRDYEDFEAQQARAESVLQALADVPYHVIFKGHQFLEAAYRANGGTTLPAWVETNELLAITDVLLTDYSSIGIDFLATGRPVIYYVDDEEAYINGRGLNVPVDDFPGWVCRALSEVQELLSSPLQAKTLNEWQRALIAFDDGHATERVCDFMFHKTPVPARKNKPDILMHTAALPNGITTASLNLLAGIRDSFDVYLMYDYDKLKDNDFIHAKLHEMEGAHVLPQTGSMLQTVEEQWCAKKVPAYRESRIGKNFEDIIRLMYQREGQRLFHTVKFDAAVEYEGYSTYYSSMIAGCNAKKRIIFQHNTMEEEFREKYRYLATVFRSYQWYDKIIAVSRATYLENMNYLSREWNLPREKFGYIDNMLDDSRVQILAQDALPENAEEMFDGAPLFLTMGRLSLEKDHAKLIRAFAGVVGQYPRARLLILGEGYLYNSLKSLVQNLDLQQNVILTGRIDNPYPWLARADCFVLSSNHEGQPMVLLEAMALRKPIISTDIPSTRGMLGNTTAMLVENTELALADGLLACCKQLPKPVEMDFEEYNKHCIGQFHEIVNCNL